MPATDQSDATQAWTAPAQPAQPLSEPQEAAKWARFRFRHFTPSGCGVDVAVGAGVSSLAVTFARAESNASYGIHILPSWSTTVYVATTDKLATGFTAHFGTSSPGGGGTLSWATFRSEDT